MSNEQSQQEKEAKSQAEKDKRTSELSFATKQSEADKKLLKDTVAVVEEIVENEVKDTKEDALLVQAKLQEINKILEILTKSGNVMKPLIDDQDRLNLLFDEENEVKKLVHDTRSDAAVFIRTQPLAYE